MNGIILTHGAGSNADAPLLIALAAAFEAAGWKAVRYTLPFRQSGRKGPPLPAHQAADRAGLADQTAKMRAQIDGIVAIGGHSYGGRQASILASEQPGLIDALLLLSYPLHPPDKPAQLRTAHFPNLMTPALFISGVRDPFATMQELQTAIAAVPAPTRIIPVERAGHDLKGADTRMIVAEFEQTIR